MEGDTERPSASDRQQSRPRREAGGTASPVYDRDDGEEKFYYGRGSVQLTWWSNYAETGLMIGCGLDLLLDPDSIEDRRVSVPAGRPSARTRPASSQTRGHGARIPPEAMTFHRRSCRQALGSRRSTQMPPVGPLRYSSLLPSHHHSPSTSIPFPTSDRSVPEDRTLSSQGRGDEVFWQRAGHSAGRPHLNRDGDRIRSRHLRRLAPPRASIVYNVPSGELANPARWSADS